MNPDLIRILGQELFRYYDFAPKQLGISSRKINYWVDKKLLPFVERHEGSASNRNKWVRLNLANAIWAGIIQELLDVGVSSKRLAALAEAVWHKPRVEKYADKVIRMAINQKRNPLPPDDIEKLKQILKDEMLMETVRTEINPFTDLVKSCLLNRKLPHSLLYIPKTGEYKFLSHQDDLMIRLSNQWIDSSLVSIPMAPIFSKVVATEFFYMNRDLSYLTDIEKQIRDIVVFKKPKYLEIAIENDEILPLAITEKHKSREQLAEYILNNKIGTGAKLLIEVRSQDNYKITLIPKK